jgi:MFS family permease
LNSKITALVDEPARAWPVVLVAALAVGFGTMGMGFYALGLFVKPLQAEFGWSRAAVSGAATFQQLGIFLSAPLAGRLSDRIGVRPIAIASAIAMPLALLALSRAGPSVPAWFALWLLVSLAGCGTTPAVWARVVTQRFDRSRGLALGLMLMGTGAAAVLAPVLLGDVVAGQGWRVAVLAMAAAALLAGLPLALMVPNSPHVPTAQREAGVVEWNRATITLLVTGFGLGLVVAGLIVHLVPMLIDRGVAPVAAARLAAGIGLAVLVSRAVVGWLFDRFHAPFVAALFLAMPIGSCALLGLGGPVLPAALLIGLAAGAEVDMLAFFTSRYVAPRNFGASYGTILGTFCLGAGLGPLLIGFSVDWTGSYRAALIASTIALAVIVALVAGLGRYRSA